MKQKLAIAFVLIAVLAACEDDRSPCEQLSAKIYECDYFKGAYMGTDESGYADRCESKQYDDEKTQCLLECNYTDSCDDFHECTGPCFEDYLEERELP